MQIFNGFIWVKPENIEFATCMKNIRLRFALSDIFHTCSSSNIFRYHPQAIQYCIKLGQSDQYLDHYSRHAQTMVGSEVTMGSKRSFSPKRHQVLQNT